MSLDGCRRGELGAESVEQGLTLGETRAAFVERENGVRFLCIERDGNPVRRAELLNGRSICGQEVSGGDQSTGEEGN